MIRHFIPSDIPSILSLFNHYIESGWVIPYEEKRTLEGLQNLFLSRYTAYGTYQSFVLEVGGKVVGMVASNPAGPMAHQSRAVECGICIDPEFCGQGCGEQLYKRLFKALRRQPLDSITAYVTLPNEASVKLHKKVGFEEVGILKKHTHKFGVSRDVMIFQVENDRHEVSLESLLATRSDQPDIQNLIFEVLKEYGLPVDPSGTDQDLFDLEASYFSKGGTFEIVRSPQGRLLATWALSRVSESECELRKMYMVKDVRGQGLGRWLLEKAMKAAKDQGYKTMSLETASVLTEAIGLYKSYGFKPSTCSNQTSRCDLVMSREV